MNDYTVGKHDYALPDSTNTGSVDDDIRKLRARGMSVSRIAQLLNECEFRVARVCGVSLWKGRDTRTMERAT